MTLPTTTAKFRRAHPVRWALVSALVAAVVFPAVTTWVVLQYRSAVSVIAQDAAPSVVAAQEIRVGMIDMDASVANFLMASSPQLAEEARKEYDNGSKMVSSALADAERNLTFPGEKAPIQLLKERLAEYSALTSKAMDAKASDPAQALAYYRQAQQLVDSKLLGAAEELDSVNRGELEHAYTAIRERSVTLWVAFFGASGFLLAALAALTNRLTNRGQNPVSREMIAAIVLSLLLQGFIGYTLFLEERDVKVAKEDAFDSIHALWGALASGYVANTAESRYLADPAEAERHEKSFLARSAEIAQPPQGLTLGVLAATAKSGGALPADFKGLIADELHNITFPGEREAASAVLEQWNLYLGIDGKIRELNRKGERDAAIALCVGSAENQSNWAFAKFETALRASIRINQDAFDAAVGHAQSRIARLEWFVSAVCLMLIVVILAAVRHRLRGFGKAKA